MYLKIYKNGEQILVAACDEEVLGKSLKHGKAVVEISRASMKGNAFPKKNSRKPLKRLRLQTFLGKKQSAVP